MDRKKVLLFFIKTAILARVKMQKYAKDWSGIFGRINATERSYLLCIIIFKYSIITYLAPSRKILRRRVPQKLIFLFPGPYLGMETFQMWNHLVEPISCCLECDPQISVFPSSPSSSASSTCFKYFDSIPLSRVGAILDFWPPPKQRQNPPPPKGSRLASWKSLYFPDPFLLLLLNIRINYVLSRELAD